MTLPGNTCLSRTICRCRVQFALVSAAHSPYHEADACALLTTLVKRHWRAQCLLDGLRIEAFGDFIQGNWGACEQGTLWHVIEAWYTAVNASQRDWHVTQPLHH